MNDLDLEDIESHLYSQVYHSTDRTEEDSNNVTLENPEQSTQNMGNPNRYFQRNKKNANFNQAKGIVNYLRKLNSNVQDNTACNEYLYTKDSGVPFKPLNVPFSQAFALRGRAKYRERRKRKRAIAKLYKTQQYPVYKVSKGPQQNEIIVVSDSDGESCVEITQNWPTLSVADSDDETDKKIPLNHAVKTLSEPPADATDDVIFVEPSNMPVEIINIDEEVDRTRQKSPDEINAHVDVETASVTSSTNSFINAYSLTKSPSTKNTHKERRELLSTPDSASNDFINNTGVEVGQKDFNFSLHGKDFNDDQFVKPTNPIEACETESSSSTTDNNVLNTMKTIVFNEIEFPKEGFFSEANLETFGNFITPLRKTTVKKIAQSSTPTESMSPSRSQNVYSSDSSSESDFDDNDADNVKELTKKSKNLPELSPMLLEKKTLQAVKKSKLNISSKYDILNASAVEVIKPAGQKKRKSQSNEGGTATKKKSKNKKRKTDTKSSKTVVEAEDNSFVDNSTLDTSIVDESQLDVSTQERTECETTQKKKKSREVLEEMVENSDIIHSKKKTKTKKRKSFTESEVADKNINDGQSQLELQKDSSDQNQGQDDQNRDNVDTITCTKPADESIKESLPANVKIENDEQSTKEELSEVSANVQVSAVKVEPVETTETTDKKSENDENKKMENITNVTEQLDVKLEMSDDVIILENTANEEDIQVILSSDSESKLSPLNDQQDIQLLNCEEPNSQGSRTVILNYSENSDDVNLTHSTVAEVQQNMSSDPKMWMILDCDRMPPDKEPILNRRCNRCREKGHMAVRCPNKVLPKCRLCGQCGHFEPRCPNRICTQCGTRTSYSTTSCGICTKYKNRKCELCFMTGHPATACPDLWRRYHMTTSEGPLRYSRGPLLKPKQKLWCSGCARSGHLEYTCRFYKSMYPPTDPRIKSYVDVYDDNSSAQVQQVGQTLCYNVNNNYNVNMQPNEQSYPLYRNQSNYSMNSYVDNRIFVNNQGNFVQPGTLNPMPMQNAGYYHDIDTYQRQDWQSNQQFFFEDNLPNFISFDAPLTFEYNNPGGNIPSNSRYYESNMNVQSEVIGYNMYKPNTTVFQSKQYAGIFFSSPAESVRHFIMKELQILFKMTRDVNNVVRNLKRYQVGKHSKNEVEKYYKRLNMVLFGIFKLNEGEKHLGKLKKFRVQPIRAKLNQQRRRDLHKSYCYIFGKEKHTGVDYNELLSRI